VSVGVLRKIKEHVGRRDWRSRTMGQYLLGDVCGHAGDQYAEPVLGYVLHDTWAPLIAGVEE